MSTVGLRLHLTYSCYYWGLFLGAAYLHANGAFTSLVVYKPTSVPPHIPPLKKLTGQEQFMVITIPLTSRLKYQTDNHNRPSIAKRNNKIRIFTNIKYHCACQIFQTTCTEPQHPQKSPMAIFTLIKIHIQCKTAAGETQTRKCQEKKNGIKNTAFTKSHKYVNLTIKKKSFV